MVFKDNEVLSNLYADITKKADVPQAPPPKQVEPTKAQTELFNAAREVLHQTREELTFKTLYSKAVTDSNLNFK